MMITGMVFEGQSSALPYHSTTRDDWLAVHVHCVHDLAANQSVAGNTCDEFAPVSVATPEP